MIFSDIGLQGYVYRRTHLHLGKGWEKPPLCSQGQDKDSWHPKASGEVQMQNPLPLQERQEKQSLNASPKQDSAQLSLRKEEITFSCTRPTLDTRSRAAAMGGAEAGTLRRPIPRGRTHLPFKDQ